MKTPWLLALALLAGPAAAQAPLRLEEDTADVDALARRLGLATGRTILVAPGVVADGPLSVEGATWREAVDALAARAACEVVEVDDALVLLRPRAAVSLSLTRADARFALQLLTAHAGRDLVVDADVPRALVTLELAEAPWEEALGALAAAAGLDVERDGDLLRARPGPGEVRVAGRLPGWLRPAWPGRRLLEGPRVGLAGDDAWALAAPAAAAAGASLVVDPVVAAAGAEPTAWEPLPWRAALARVALREGWRLADERGVVVVRAAWTPSLQLGEVEARAALELLAGQVDRSVVVEPGVVGQLTLDLKGLAAGEAVAAVAAAVGAEVEDQGDLLVVRPRGGPRARPRAAWSPALGGPAVDLDAAGRPLAEVLVELGARAGASVDAAWPPRVGDELPPDERVHARLRGVPWQAAVDLLARVHGCEVLPAAGGLRVEPPARLRLTVAGADVAVVASELAARAGLSVALDEGLGGSAPLEVRVGSWRRALEALALSLGADLVDEGPGRVRVARRPGAPAGAAAPPAPPWDEALEAFAAALRAEAGPAIERLFRPAEAPVEPPAEAPSLHDLLALARQRLDADAIEEAARLCDEAWVRAEGSPALEGLVAALRERTHALRRLRAADLRPTALLVDERAGTAAALVGRRFVRAGDDLRLEGDLEVRVLQVDRAAVRYSAAGVTFVRERGR